MASFGRELSRRKRGTCKSRSPSTFVGGNLLPPWTQGRFARVLPFARASGLRKAQTAERSIIENPGHSITALTQFANPKSCFKTFLYTERRKNRGTFAVFSHKMAFLKSKFKDDPVRVQRHTVRHFKDFE